MVKIIGINTTTFEKMLIFTIAFNESVRSEECDFNLILQTLKKYRALYVISHGGSDGVAVNSRYYVLMPADQF